MIGRPPLEGLYPESPAGTKAKDSAAKVKEARREKERRDLEELLKEEMEKAGDAKDTGDEGPTGDDGQERPGRADEDEMVLTHVTEEKGEKAPAARSRKNLGAERTEAEKEEDALGTLATAKPKAHLGRMSQGRRRLAIIGIVALILIPLLYFLVIPRTEVVITVQYAEGFQNAIYIDAKAENRGSRPVDGLTVKISVVNETDIVVMTTEMDTSSSISIWSERDFDFHRFQGNQRVNFALIVDVELESAGHSYSSSDTFYVKDYMNQRFELTVRG